MEVISSVIYIKNFYDIKYKLATRNVATKTLSLIDNYTFLLK